MIPPSLGPYEIGPKTSDRDAVSIWSAQDRRRGRPARVLLGDRESLDSVTADSFLERARTFGAIDVRALLGVHETGVTPDGAPYVVTDAADRGSVARRQGVGTGATDGDLRRIAAGAGNGLSAVHQRNLVYQTLGPESLLLVAGPATVGTSGGVLFEDDVVRLDVPGPLPQDFAADRLAAPEQLAGDAATRRTDIYRLSGVLAEVAAGRERRPDEEWSSLLREVGQDRPKLASALSKGLSQRASERPASLAIWSEGVQGALVPAGRAAGPAAAGSGSKALWAAAAALVLIAGVAALSLMGGSDEDVVAVAPADAPTAVPTLGEGPTSVPGEATAEPALTEVEPTTAPSAVAPTPVPTQAEATPEPDAASVPDEGSETGGASAEGSETDSASDEGSETDDSSETDDASADDADSESTASDSDVSDASADRPAEPASDAAAGGPGEASSTGDGQAGSAGAADPGTTAIPPSASGQPIAPVSPAVDDGYYVAGTTLSPVTGVPVWDGISYCPPGGTDPAPGLVVAEATNHALVVTYDPLPDFLNVFVDGKFHDTLIPGSDRYVIEGLDPRTTYSVTVAREGDRANGSMICGRTLSFAPSPRPLGAYMPSDIRIVEVTPTSVTIQWWAESPDAMHSLHLNGSKVKEVPVGWRQYTFEGLAPGSTNRIGLRSVLNNNRSDQVAFDVTTPVQ